MVPILLQVPSGDINSEISSVSGLAEQEVTFSKTQNFEAYLSFSNNEAIDPPVYVVDDSFYNRFEDLSFEQSPSPIYSKFQYDEELTDCTSSYVSEIKLFKIYMMKRLLNVKPKLQNLKRKNISMTKLSEGFTSRNKYFTDFILSIQTFLCATSYRA